MFRILLFAVMLTALLVLRKPCARGVTSFVESFQGPPRENRGGTDVIRITGEETEEELKQKLSGKKPPKNPRGIPEDSRVIYLTGDESPEELHRLGISPKDESNPETPGN